MASLFIREYANIAGARGRSAPVPMEPGTDQSVLTFSTSAASAAFGATTKLVRIYSDTAFHYVVAADPTATTSHLKWPASTPCEFGVLPGQKVAVIAAA